MTNSRPKVALDDRFTITEAAKVLGVHRNTLLKACYSKMLKFGCRRTTGRKFFTGRELIRYWEAVL